MKLLKTKVELDNYLTQTKISGKQIGFVPTMGALHQGHISLFEQSLFETDITIGSIFVNPVQFNNASDLEKYPRVPEKDLALLEDAGVHAIFMPTEEEIYPEPPKEKYNFGDLELVMEGAQRPGHFNGVAIVVRRLFDLVKPDYAYFGLKDFQQLAIIQELVAQYEIPVEIKPCKIVRENDGLAMSSRNMRLSEDARKIAPKIYKTLFEAKKLSSTKSISEVKSFVEQQIAKEKKFKLEYFEIADSKSLQPTDCWKNENGVVGCIVVWLDGVRLIDNIQFS